MFEITKLFNSTLHFLSWENVLEILGKMSQSLKYKM